MILILLKQKENQIKIVPTNEKKKQEYSRVLMLPIHTMENQFHFGLLIMFSERTEQVLLWQFQRTMNVTLNSRKNTIYPLDRVFENIGSIKMRERLGNE